MAIADAAAAFFAAAAIDAAFIYTVNKNGRRQNRHHAPMLIRMMPSLRLMLLPPADAHTLAYVAYADMLADA